MLNGRWHHGHRYAGITRGARIVRHGVLIAVLSAPAIAWGCGYHDSASVALGSLNWAFPDSLHVRTAVWRAEDAGILPPRGNEVRSPFAYHDMVKRLQTMADRLSDAARDGAVPVSFTAILFDSMLWVRFAATNSGYVLYPHVGGPESGDVVVVTDGRVIRALAGGLLDARQAASLDLFRIYGRQDQNDKLRELIVSALGRDSASADKRVDPQ